MLWIIENGKNPEEKMYLMKNLEILHKRSWIAKRNPGSRPSTWKARENPGSRPSTFYDCEFHLRCHTFQQPPIKYIILNLLIVQTLMPSDVTLSSTCRPIWLEFSSLGLESTNPRGLLARSGLFTDHQKILAAILIDKRNKSQNSPNPRRCAGVR
jgi:hypothetical protein